MVFLSQSYFWDNFAYFKNLVRVYTFNYDPFIKANTDELHYFKYERNHVNIQLELVKCGTFVAITNDFSFTPERLLKVIREKNEIELPFKYMKTSFDAEKLRVYSETTFLGKNFNTFITAIIKCQLI